MEERIEEGVLDFYKRVMNLKEVDPAAYSPLVFAYVGDAVYEVIIRMKVVNGGNLQPNKLHKHSSRLVCAKTQAQMIRLLEEELTEEEHAVFKRGRNAKSSTSAKHASITDYRFATGFEALLGWLAVTKQYKRLIELVSHGLKKIGEEKTCDTEN